MGADIDGRKRGTLRPKLKVWVVFRGGAKFGDGRARLLELIHELGSIKKAVVRSRMSYRNAWGYLSELEKAAGFNFIERTRGAGLRSGSRLTKEGKEFLRRYRQFRRGLDKVVAREFKRSFPRG